MIVSIASKARDAWSSAMSLGQTNRIFARVLQTSHINGWFLFAKRTSYHICFFYWFCGIEKLEEFPQDRVSPKTWCHGLSLISNNPHIRCEHLCIIFSASAPSGPNLFSITRIKVMTSGIAFDRSLRSSRSSRSSQSSESVSIWSLQNLHDRPDRPDRSQLYPSDRGRLSRPGRLRSSR